MFAVLFFYSNYGFILTGFLVEIFFFFILFILWLSISVSMLELISTLFIYILKLNMFNIIQI